MTSAAPVPGESGRPDERACAGCALPKRTFAAPAQISGA